MRCKRCEQEIAKGEFCRRCLVKVVERRVRKDIRLKAGINKGTKILVMDPLSAYFAGNLLPAVEIVRKSASSFGIRQWDSYVYKNSALNDFLNRKGIDIAFAPLPMETGPDHYLECLFSGKKPSQPAQGKIFPLFSHVSADELELFCRSKKLTFPRFGGYSLGFLDRMEKSYPGTKASLAKAVKQQNIK